MVLSVNVSLRWSCGSVQVLLAVICSKYSTRPNLNSSNIAFLYIDHWLPERKDILDCPVLMMQNIWIISLVQTFETIKKPPNVKYVQESLRNICKPLELLFGWILVYSDLKCYQ